MLQARFGKKFGHRIGKAFGIGADELAYGIGSLPVTADATNGKLIPQTPTEWSNFSANYSLGLGALTGLWLFQEAAGNPADSSGNGLTLTASGSPAYLQAVTGWSTKCISFADAATGALASTAAGLPDISTTSALLIAYVRMPAAAPAGTRNIASLGTVAATRTAIEMLNTGLVRGFTNANTANGAANPFNAVHPIVIQVDRTNNTTVIYTDQEKLTPTFSAGTTGKAINLGNSSNPDANEGFLWAALLSGASAEISVGTVRSVLQDLGWSVAW